MTLQIPLASLENLYPYEKMTENECEIKILPEVDAGVSERDVGGL